MPAIFNPRKRSWSSQQQKPWMTWSRNKSMQRGAFPRDYAFFAAVVKTRIQVDPAYRKLNMIPGTLVNRGASVPTAVGYLVRGDAKFAGCEYWKKKSMEWVGSPDDTIEYRTAIYLRSANILLTRPEAMRIRLVSQRNYATGLVTGLTRLAREGGIAELYAGFLPILCKQIPYTMGHFAVAEFRHEVVFRAMSEEARRNLSGASKFTIQLGSGIATGFEAAILSHPTVRRPTAADTLLSQINKGTHRLDVLTRQAGFRGLFTGFGPRMFMTAGLVTGQYLMYESIKHGMTLSCFFGSR
ncbi:mitochondrial carrier [Gyrodon lividus]|nr:mitochondrial carrier [Gyrodon lividus]